MATGNLPANTLVANRYLIMKKIGTGGMGAVYLVSDTRLGNHKCALKEMSTAALKSPQEQQEAIKGFEREAKILSSLSHPNLPRVTDYFSEQNNNFLVVDFVEGDTLQDLLDARSQPYSETQVIHWVEQLCDVLEYLHNQNPPVIFRDLKPGNIMIAPDNKTVKLIDFGIARNFRPGASKDTVALGTPGYAAPEQYGKGQSDARSDIYALGATIHYLLSKRDPSVDPMNFPRLGTLNPNVSQSVEMAVHRAVELKPPSRWKNVEEMRNALMGQIAGIHGPGITPSSLQQPATPPVTVIGPQPSAASQRAMQPPVVVSPPATVGTPPSQTPGRQVYKAPYTPQLYANYGPRFAAYMIDSIILFISYLLLSVPLLAMGDEALMVLYIIIVSFFGLGYYAYFHSRGGQTPGKKITKICVVRRDGSPLSVGRAIWRAVAFLLIPALLTAICYVGWLLYLVPLFHKENRALHDVLADTWVIKV